MPGLTVATKDQPPRQLPEVYPSSQAEKDHAAHVLKALQRKRATNHKTDVTIVCAGKKEVRAHRLVLMAASPYFAEQDDMDEDRFYFPTVKVEDMEIVLDFIYSGRIIAEDKIKEDRGRLLGVMKAAETFKAPVLAKWCQHRLAENVDVLNFAEMFDLADEYQNDGLVARYITFVVKNFADIVRTKQIVNLEPKQLSRVLQHPDMVQYCMDDIVKAILRWVEYDPERKQHLNSLIHPLDLSYLSRAYLSTLMGSTLMKHDKDLLAVLIGESSRRSMNPGCNNDNLCKIGQQFVCLGKLDQLRTVSVYDTESNTWSSPGSPPFLFDRGMAMVGYGHLVYLFGGGGWPPNPASTVIEYCPTTNVSSDAVGTLSVPTCRAGAIVCNDYMYIINGVSREMKRHNVVQRYNARSGTSDLVAPTMQSHFCPLGFSYNSCMYIVGCYNNDEKAVETYDPVGNQWTIVTSVPGNIEWCRGAFSGNRLFIIRNKDATTIQMYDLVTGEWRETPLDIQGPPSNEWGCWIAKKGDKEMLYARWGNNVMHCYDFEAMKWITHSEPNEAVWNYLLTCVVWR